MVDPSDSSLLDDPDVVTFRDPTKWPDTWRARFVPTDPLDADAYDKLFRSVYERMWTWVLVDEAAMVLPANPTRSSAARQVLIQGRKRSIGLAACNTRPSNVDVYARTEAEHLFIFRLTAGDAKALAIDAGLDVAMVVDTVPTLPERWFLYVDKRAGRSFVHPPL